MKETETFYNQLLKFIQIR